MEFEDFKKTDTYKLLFQKFITAGTEEELHLAMKQYFGEVEYFLKLAKEDDGK